MIFTSCEWQYYQRLWLYN